MTANFARIEQIFTEAVSKPDAADREVYLNQVCDGDTQLRRHVEDLLAADAESGSFLPLPNDGSTLNFEFVSERPGTTIGRYQLLEQIGEGGFGVVFMAQQEQPIRRRVALKVVKAGMDTKQVVARFGAERQALAMMDHPNIAKVFDAGTTETGRPYFVMELVQGVAITKYCDKCNLTTVERLELLISVCQAVQHAHQKGVIHRDIKPSNVLVAIQDGQPAPKIIDFGVAKAIDQQLTEQTLITAYSQMVGTPLYMSPEQAELSPLGVDTRSDIYSLGVLLYELLTGTTPFDKDRLHAASYDEIRRIIREEEPPRPSGRLSTLAADLATTVAEHHRTDARRLRQTVHGELDWIVMKCLEKDRNRRYESAGSLARDLEHYLRDEPVQACPPSRVYRLRKYARRNKVALAFVTLLLTGIVFLAYSNLAVTRERDAKTTALARATSVSNLLQEMLASSNPEQVKGLKYTVRELLDDFSGGLGDQLAGQPEVEASIRSVIGNAYCRLGVNNRAELHLQKALDLRRQVFDAGDVRVADSLVDYAWNLAEQSRHGEAETCVREALSIYQQNDADPRAIVRALWSLQRYLISQSRRAEAEQVAHEALALAGERVESDYAELPNILHGLADAKRTEGKYAESEKWARQAVEMHRRLHGDHHPETAWGLLTLGSALKAQHQLAEAEKSLRESRAIFREHYTPEHKTLQTVSAELKSVLDAKGDRAALDALAKEEVDQATRSDSPDNQVRLAGILLAGNPSTDAQKEEARRLIRRAIETYKRAPVDYSRDFRRRINAADGCNRAIQVCVVEPSLGKEVDEMSRLVEAELPRLLADFPDSSQCQWEVAMAYETLGVLLSEHVDFLPTAEQALTKSIEILEEYTRTDPNRGYLWVWFANAYQGLGEVQWRSGRLDEAEASLQRAMQIYSDHEEKIAADIAAEPLSGINSAIISHHLCFAAFLSASHREEEAGEFVRKAALYTKRLTNPAELPDMLYLIALMQLRLGDTAAYRATCEALAEVPVQNAEDLVRVRLIITPCLGPDALNDLSPVVTRAEEFVAYNSLNQPHFGLTFLGVALYRTGQYVRAAQVLEESIAAYPADPSPGFHTINYQRLFLAMAQWHLTKQDEARQILAETLPAVEDALQSPSLPWNRQATLAVLRREAIELIGEAAP